jgi:hypothetical protein
MVTGSGPDLGPLREMTAALATTGHNFTMTTVGSSMIGSVDPARHAAGAEATGNGVDLAEVVVNGQIYLRADLGAGLDQQTGITPNAWMTLDPAEITTTNELLVQPDGSDPVDLGGIETGITALQRSDVHHLQGTLDLTRVTGHTLPDPDEVVQAGNAAKSAPFTVTADASGRISQFEVNADGFDPTLSLRVDYSGYGAPHSITPPTGAVAAPAGIYALFNG